MITENKPKTMRDFINIVESATMDDYSHVNQNNRGRYDLYEGEGWDPLQGIPAPKLGFEEGDKVGYDDDTCIGVVREMYTDGGMPEDHLWSKEDHDGNELPPEEWTEAHPQMEDYHACWVVTVDMLDGSEEKYHYYFGFNSSNRGGMYTDWVDWPESDRMLVKCWDQ